MLIFFWYRYRIGTGRYRYRYQRKKIPEVPICTGLANFCEYRYRKYVLLKKIDLDFYLNYTGKWYLEYSLCQTGVCICFHEKLHMEKISDLNKQFFIKSTALIVPVPYIYQLYGTSSWITQWDENLTGYSQYRYGYLAMCTLLHDNAQLLVC
jgi:hypothetical protein